QQLLLVTGWSEAQLVRHRSYDLFLDGDEVGERAGVLTAPQLGICCDIDQVGLNVQSVATLDDAAREDRAHGQLTANSLEVQFAAFVAKHRTPRYDPQRGQLREAVDQVLRDAIAQILSVWVSADVDEGQDRERVDRAAGRGSCDPQSSHNEGDHKQYRRSRRDEEPQPAPRHHADWLCRIRTRLT